LDPQLMVLGHAIELKLAAAGIFNSETEGLLSHHPEWGPRAALVIRIGKPWPSLATMAAVQGEILELFKGGKVDLILDESVVAGG